MVHIRHRSDLFRIAEENPPSPAIGEALSTGGVELLGGFDRVPPSRFPGWIIVVTSKRGTVWNIVITPHVHPDRVAVWIVERVPWELWVGSTNRDPGLYDGDHPIKYEERSAKARIASGY